MFNSRKELMEATKKTYVSLLNRIANRYYNNEQYVISDIVGFECTKLEDIFRPMWGIAGVLKETDLQIEVNGKKISAIDFINEVICDGTDKNSPHYFSRNVTDFNKVTFSNQSITEIAAYMILVYFSKETVWDILPEEKKNQIALWVKEWAIFALKNSWRNNHFWYPVFCVEVLKYLGYDCSEADQPLKEAYDFLETLYCGNGWYYDGIYGRFDYYEAWAHHAYTLLWILIADKNTDYYEEKANTYRRRSEEFLNFFANYFDSDGGMVAYGRSIGYRFGAVCPYGLAVMAGCKIDPALAKTVVLKNISYFYEKSIPTKDGCFPLGYLYEAPRFAESYATDGAISCYCEGYMCLLMDENHPFWQADITKLPLENSDFIIENPLEGVSAAIRGEDDINGITLFNNSIHYYQSKFFGNKFNDMGSYYSKFCYNSRAGYSLSVADNTSIDNMISLVTEDGVMSSHRKKIYDSKCENGIFSSYHIPFSNDSESVIKTYLVPLKKGWHVLVHKVKLSQKYFVMEGGFTVGITDDNYIAEENRAYYGEEKSEIYVESDVPVTLLPKLAHPGMHLLKPQAIYPTYKTGLLDAGEYLFVTSVCYVSKGDITDRPQIKREEGKIIISQGETEKTVEL